MGEANPALEHEISPPLHALAKSPVPADVAYQLVHDELLLDGSARLNLATFVTTWMEPQAARLMAESLDKNMIDKDEYPQTAAIENRCVAILADLWHAPEQTVATGCSTTGSSEACMLAGMALKRRWSTRTAAGPGPQTEPGDGSQCPGLLGEILPVLGCRATPGTAGRRPAAPRCGRGSRPL